MIAYYQKSTHVKNHLLQQIQIKENQLKIAQKFNMLYVAEALHSQLSHLQHQLLSLQDPEFQALMSLLDD
ncbi:hypothetical protein BZZ01_07285 [Nostocales cyanobacterium HT-58-2]|nr:hypothetical protein BZZ01_07285 [Nostocales cyanobacterium HT-58-2]